MFYMYFRLFYMCFVMFYKCFTMFNDVLLCLGSRSMSGFDDCTISAPRDCQSANCPTGTELLQSTFRTELRGLSCDKYKFFIIHFREK